MNNIFFGAFFSPERGIDIAVDASETWPVDSNMSPADVVGLVDKNDPWAVATVPV